MRRFALATLALLLLAAPVSAAGARTQPQPAAAAASANPLGIQAQSAVLLDARANTILYAWQPSLRLQPASLAKMMTLLLALEAVRDGQIQLTTPVTVSKDAWQLAEQLGPLSDMGLQVGQKVPFQDLLYGLVVSSGNDAAVAIAEALAGSQQAFVAEMNARAAQLGLASTHFATVHGLPATDQYTTALDMAHLAQYLVLQDPQVAQYTSRQSFAWNGITQPNFNLPLMQMDPRVFGIKTGHVDAGGYHLAAAARQGSQLLVAVVMGAASDSARSQQAETLLKYGFGQWDTLTLDWHRYAPADVHVWTGAGQVVPIAPAQPVVVAVPRNEVSALKVAAVLNPAVRAPLAAGAVVGSIRISAPDAPTRSIPLLAAAPMAQGPLLQVLWDDVRLFALEVWRSL